MEISVNFRTGKRAYIDSEARSAGAVMGYAHLQEADQVDPGEPMRVFRYRWEHFKTGKAGIQKIACHSMSDLGNYLALWNVRGRGYWRYTAL